MFKMFKDKFTRHLFFANKKWLSKKEIVNLLLIIVVWIVISAIVNPLGDFPLNDDWVYGRAVQSIVEKGNFTLSGGNTSVNLIVQAFWGALFCLPFGFSFFSLRLSTLTLGLIGVLATYGLLREVGATRQISLFGAFLILLNPIYFGLSNTFMTDIPFFAVAIVSLYFLIRGLKYNRKIEVIFGIILCCLSLLVRQNAIIILVAFGGAYLVKQGLSKASIIRAVVPTFFGISLQLIYQNWLELTARTSPNFNMQSRGIGEIIFSDRIGNTIANLASNTLIALIYIGLFIAPLAIIVFFEKLKALPFSKRRASIFAILSLFVLMIVGIVKSHKLMPLRGNILTSFGLGPLTLHDYSFLGINYSFTPTILKYSWAALSAIAVFSAIFLIYCLLVNARKIFQKSESVKQKWLNTLVVLSIIFYFLPLGIISGSDRYPLFDRYFLFLIPLFMIVVVIYWQEISKTYSINTKAISTALAILLIYGGFTIGATHDYLSWNRVRWQALNSLLNETKILPNYIDGGYEFNGWYLYNSNDTYSINFQRNPKKPDKSWWYVDRDDYMIAFGPLAAYEEFKRYPTGRWLPFGPETIYVLRKKTVQSP